MVNSPSGSALKPRDYAASHLPKAPKCTKYLDSLLCRPNLKPITQSVYGCEAEAWVIGEFFAEARDEHVEAAAHKYTLIGPDLLYDAVALQQLIRVRCKTTPPIFAAPLTHP
jgi:hypothetical protein